VLVFLGTPFAIQLGDGSGDTHPAQVMETYTLEAAYNGGGKSFKSFR